MLLQAASDRYERQAKLALAAQRAAKQLWGDVPLAALDAWNPRQLAQRIAALQWLAARHSDEYVNAALREQGTDPAQSARVNPGAFAAVAGDGRSLVTLFDEPRIQAKTAIGNGVAAQDAWESSLKSLSRMAATAVQDAGRVSAGASMVAHRHAAGEVRQLVPPSCARCAILAGVWYRWDAGFDRHVKCDCIGIPVAENVAKDLTTDPAEAVRNGLVTGLSKAERKAFDDGADLNQIVNVHRHGGIYTAGGRKFTREGRTHFPVRPTPEQIYRDAKDRDDALSQLRRFGYLI